MFFAAAVIVTNSPATSQIAAVANELRDIKPPVAIPNPWFWIFVAVGALVVLAAIILIVLLLVSKRSGFKMPPVIPAHVRAKQKLQEALALIGNPLLFCILVSDTTRLYLEERFNFHAPERTTEEFLHELQSTNLLNADQKLSLGNFLERCDLVKFAKYEPGEPELRELHSAAIKLIDGTEPRSIESTPPPLPQEPKTETVSA